MDNIFTIIKGTYTSWVKDKMFGTKAFDSKTDIPDLKGKTVIVTGGRSIDYQESSVMSF